MRYDPRSGFSVFEVLIVAALGAGIIFAISNFVIGTAGFQDVVTQNLDARQDVEQTLQQFTTDVRSIGQSELGAYPIESATTSSLVFFSDIDLDGITERVRFFLATSTGVTTTVYRGTIEPTGTPAVYSLASEIVAPAVRNVVSSSLPLFEYFDAAFIGSQSPMTLPVVLQNIRLIRINLSIDVGPRAPKPIFYSRTANIRNLRSN